MPKAPLQGAASRASQVQSRGLLRGTPLSAALGPAAEPLRSLGCLAAGLVLLCTLRAAGAAPVAAAATVATCVPPAREESAFGQAARLREGWVFCGGHTALRCGDCPEGHGAAWCNGDCTWRQGQCIELAAELVEDEPWLQAKYAMGQVLDRREAMGGAAAAAGGPAAQGSRAAGRGPGGVQAFGGYADLLAKVMSEALTGKQALDLALARVRDLWLAGHQGPQPDAAGDSAGASTSCSHTTGAAPSPGMGTSGSEGVVAETVVPWENNKSLWATRGPEGRWNAKAREVRNAFLHAWHGYQRHAWGFDEVKPQSLRGLNTFGSVGMTILDSLTTLWLLDLPAEFEQAAKFVERDLAFGRPGVVPLLQSVFELTIRAMGGLLGAFALSGQPVFLARARELATRLLPAFNTSSRLPLAQWSLQHGSGAAQPGDTVLAEAGSLQLEWRDLSRRTGEGAFARAADEAFAALQSCGLRGLLPESFTPPGRAPAQALRSIFTLGGKADSYYEYLLKQWLQSPGEGHFKDLFLDFMRELPRVVRPAPSGELQHYKVIQLEPTGRPIWKMEHLTCFLPGTIALALLALPPEEVAPHRGNWTALAEGLAASCVEMWTSTTTGLAPEHVLVEPEHPHLFGAIPSDGKHSLLRPETAESLYYLYRLTRKAKYRRWGEKLFRAIILKTSGPAGYSCIDDVQQAQPNRLDEMPTFVLAETFKYLYLLFAPPGLLDLDRYVLNTEGHPLQRQTSGRPRE